MDELILAKAKELFFSYGLKSVSMDDLAKMAGVSKKTIYQSFADKAELITQVVEDLVQCHHEQFVACKATAKDAVEELLMQSDEPFGIWASVNQSFFYELEKSFPEAWEKVEKHRKEVYLPGVVQNLKRGVREGLYRDDMDVAFVANIRIHQLTSVLQSHVFVNKTTSSAQAVKELTNFYLHGITTEKGKKLLNKYLKNRNENRSTK